MTDLRRLEDLLRAEEGDPGCEAGAGIMDQYVEIELRGGDPGARFPGTAIHIRACPGCRADHDGLLEAVRRAAGAGPGDGAR